MPRDSAQRSGRVKLECPRCHEHHLVRIARRGLLRNRIFPLFGLYPWQCAICGKQCLIRKRSAGYRRTSEAQERDQPSAPHEETLRAR